MTENIKQVRVIPIVVAHEKRWGMAANLSQDLRHAEIALDDGSRGDWGNHAHALRLGAQRAAETRGSHVLLIEDDAIIVKGFEAAVQDALSHHPDGIVSFYVGTGRPRQGGVAAAIKVADLQGSTWLEADALLWGVCYAIPVADIEPLLEWCDQRVDVPSDRRIGEWYRKQGRAVLYTWPSLVDHADGEPVITGRTRGEERKAWRVGRVARYRGEPVTIQRGL